MFVSKSDYLLFKQCPKSLWLHKNKPELMQLGDIQKQLEKGNEVTKEARELFPGGKLVKYSSNMIEMLEKTQKLLDDGEITIYEAAFEHDGALVICDVIHKEFDKWNVYEVKSSTSVKERHIDDISFQQFVVAKNIDVNTINLVYLNNDYARNGALDLKQLFCVEDVTEEAIKKQGIMEQDIKTMKKLVLGAMPVCDIGLYCNKYGKDDFPCAAKEHCWKHIPEYSVFNISRIGKKAFDLYKNGITLLSDIPEDYKLSESQWFQVKSYKEGISILNKEAIESFLESFTLPLYFLDFETYQQSIPLYNGVKSYQQLPFQYSLHVVKDEKSELEHYEFLAKEGKDPRRHLAESLVRDIPVDVTSVAYNMSFEKMVLKSLAHQFPDLSDHLFNIHDNMVDLMIPFQKKWFYTNEMRGSYSIKYVLPALLPGNKELDYKQLVIQNGSMAMEIYERLHTQSPEEIKEIRKNLLAYCKLDTLAMVRIWEVLKNIC